MDCSGVALGLDVDNSFGQMIWQNLPSMVHLDLLSSKSSPAVPRDAAIAFVPGFMFQSISAVKPRANTHPPLLEQKLTGYSCRCSTNVFHAHAWRQWTRRRAQSQLHTSWLFYQRSPSWHQITFHRASTTLQQEEQCFKPNIGGTERRADDSVIVASLPARFVGKSSQQFTTEGFDDAWWTCF